MSCPIHDLGIAIVLADLSFPGFKLLSKEWQHLHSLFTLSIWAFVLFFPFGLSSNLMIYFNFIWASLKKLFKKGSSYNLLEDSADWCSALEQARQNFIFTHCPGQELASHHIDNPSYPWPKSQSTVLLSFWQMFAPSKKTHRPRYFLICLYLIIRRKNCSHVSLAGLCLHTSITWGILFYIRISCLDVWVTYFDGIFWVGSLKGGTLRVWVWLFCIWDIMTLNALYFLHELVTRICLLKQHILAAQQ